MKASIKTMRRWGMSWKGILKCLLGLHRRNWNKRGQCARCGANLKSP